MDPDSVCLPLSSLSAADVAVAGGKGANLGELVRAGFDVPDGFVVSTGAYGAVADGAGVPSSPEHVLTWRLPTDVADAITAAYRGLGEGPVAVRSSATSEDLPGAAFAGQHDTFLDVVGEGAVIESVRRCWGSLWTERAVAYRRRLGIDPASVTMAVVVQRMVPADYAGVMFTANPVTGNRDQVVIDSTPGLGDAVVSGLVTPDHAVLDGSDRIVEHVPGDAPELRSDDLVRIASLGRRAARHFGRPQDIEWALHHGRLWVVQARPMTALPPEPVRLGRARRLIGATLLELLPRRPYPMEVSAWARPSIGTHVERMLMGLAGVDVRFDEVIPAVDGVVQSFLPPAPRPTWRTAGRLWRSARKACHLRADGWRADPRYIDYLQAAARVDTTAAADQDWDELVATPRLVAGLVDIITRLRVDYLPAAAADLVRLRLLLRLLGRTELFGELIANASTMTTAANSELKAMAEQVAQDDELREAFSQSIDHMTDFVTHAPQAASFRTWLNRFLSVYGHRETSSLLLVRDPTWRDAPGTVLALVKVLLEQRATDTGSRATSDAVERLTAHPLVRLTRRQEAVEGLVRRAATGVALREDTHFELTRLMPAVHRAVLEVGRRLHERGLLERSEDVWMLTMEDLAEHDDPQAGPATTSLRQLIRRREEAYAELTASPLIATTTLYPPRTTRSEADLLTGVGGGGGRATGTVRVITDPGQFSSLRSGEVLVCAVTNPSWTPLFHVAAAVVVDNGGLASHAAIVARECGIPAVMATGSGTSVLRTGQLVEVDGDAGTVRAVGDHGR